ncbi:O-antigen ligase family protein, partial [bacterium]|nr:O-antigen ligase family protein [bacterium]
ALLFVITLPIIFFFMGSKKGPAKLILFGALLTLLFAFILTVSRGGFIGLISIALLILFKDSTRSWGVKLLILGILVIAFVQFAPESYWERIRTIFTYEQDYNVTSKYGRKALWLNGLDLMLENPVTGVGAGAIVTGIGYSYGNEGGKWMTVHNSFIQIGAELGIGGFILFILLILTSIRSLKRLRVKYAQSSGEFHDHLWLATALEVSLWGFCITSMFLSAAYFAMFYFLIAICCVLRKLELLELTQEGFVEIGVSLPKVKVKR